MKDLNISLEDFDSEEKGFLLGFKGNPKNRKQLNIFLLSFEKRFKRNVPRLGMRDLLASLRSGEAKKSGKRNGKRKKPFAVKPQYSGMRL